MRLSLAHLLVAVCLMTAAAPASAQSADVRQPQSPADLASVYRDWQQAQDPEAKIALGERLLTLEPALKTWPLGMSRPRFKAELWGGLGVLYVSRARGPHADNLEKAIGHLQSALTVWTREADPRDWAAAHNALGIAYWQRVRGERADNQEAAISHFESAQAVFTRESYPQEWAQLQNNLAVVHWNRIRGERAANVEEAILRFGAVLMVIQRDTDPARWAAAQNNLGNAYASRLRGERSDNREQAVAHLAAALTVFTRETSPSEWAQAQNNLAVAYTARTRGDRSDNQEKAIACLEAALSVFTREASPQLWAQAQHNLGSAYAERIKGGRAENNQRAIAALEAALTVFTRDAAPLDHLRTSRLLGHVLMAAGEWKRAGPVHASARQAFLLLFGQGLSDTESRALIADAGPLFADAAYAALRRGETESAFELANEGRGRMMAVALRLQSLDLPADKRAHLDELRIAIQAAQSAVDAAHATERAAAVERLVGLRRELLALVEPSVQGASRPLSGLAEARRLAATGAAVVIPVITDLGAKLLVLSGPQGRNDIAVVDVPELTLARLSDLLVGQGDKTGGWIGAYFINYLQGAELDRRWPEWLGAIDHVGPELWSLIGARLDAALKQRGIAHGARLVWLPAGWLGTLPLGLAQDSVTKRRLADDYEIVYAPSIEALTAAQELVTRRVPATLAAIVNPTGDLPGTEQEGAIVASHFESGARTVLQGDAATPQAVLAALSGKTYWHFASHGTFSWTDARQSALILRGGARLSVGNLLDARGLGRPRLVVLSACETGIYEITSSPDEFIGLPGTFMALGAAGVLASLWPVSDAATALLMAKFYDLHMNAGLSPPTALSQAQAWLRGATSTDLNDYAKVAAADGRIGGSQLAALEQELSPERLARSYRSDSSETGSNAGLAAAPPNAQVTVRPYEHPYFWASFIYTGL